MAGVPACEQRCRLIGNGSPASSRLPFRDLRMGVLNGLSCSNVNGALVVFVTYVSSK
jgi:hypothetical protein